MDKVSDEKTSFRKLLKSGISIESDQYDPKKEVRILVLYTGGTIGMKSSGGVYSPVPNFLIPELRKLPMFHDPNYDLHKYAGKEEDLPLVMLESKEGKRVLYTIYEYEPIIDSANMSMHDYIRIAKDIKRNYHQFEGFVILHGTDTMSYTASALSFMLEYLGKPVILTGSQIPIFETRSDGRDNFLGALILAGHYGIPEVMVYFHNQLLRGNRSTKVDSGAMDAFKSPNLHPLAELGINIKVHWKAVYRPPKNQPFQIQDKLSLNVGLLRFFPSITAETVRAFMQAPMQGVVLQSYGAGNGPDARKDILQLFKEATERGVLIVNITQCSRGKVTAAYAAGKALLDAGVIAGADMTPEAALLKLSYVLAKEEWDTSRKRQMMQRNLRGELTATEPDIEEVHLSIVDKLAKTLKISSDPEVELLQESLFPTLLCTSARKGDTHRLEMLLDAGADVKTGDYDGRRPLHIAVCEGHADIVKFLIAKGAMVHAMDRYGHTALDDAVRFAHLNIIDILVDNGAKLNLTASKLHALICNTILYEDRKTLEAWFKAGANINQADHYGKTPLHLACAIGEADRVEDLLNYGACVEAKDSHGHTPLDEAKRSNHQNIIDIIENWKTSHV